MASRGVDGQVDQDLLDVAGVGEDIAEAGVELGDQFDVLAEGPLQQVGDAGDLDVEVQHAGLDDFAAGEGQ
jgi:hypothetical protein